LAWTKITRAKYRRRDGLRYASDTTDAEWAVIEPHRPPGATCGRRHATSLRDVVNAIFYIAQSSCQWRVLPKDFPNFNTARQYSYAWRDKGRREIINHALLLAVREAAGRQAVVDVPCAATTDSRSTLGGSPSNYCWIIDGFKQINI
jgi:transposase